MHTLLFSPIVDSLCDISYHKWHMGFPYSGPTHSGWWPYDLSRRTQPGRSQWKPLLFLVGLLLLPRIDTQWKLWFIRSSDEWEDWHCGRHIWSEMCYGFFQAEVIGWIWGWSCLDSWTEGGQKLNVYACELGCTGVNLCFLNINL